MSSWTEALLQNVCLYRRNIVQFDIPTVVELMVRQIHFNTEVFVTILVCKYKAPI
jgi:hypothetical protein